MNVTTTTGNASNPTVTTAQYYFIKNLQGDIVAMADATGAIKCSYTYNSWGKVLSIAGPSGTPSLTDHTNPANINPFRYRGYYYDAENQLYWLQSRFYDPNTGRFLNADGYVTTGQGLLSTNMFLYCLNDPIQFVDESGGRCVENDARSDWVMVTPSGRVVTGGRAKPARKDLRNAPDLDINTASPGQYNCYGNGIGKQIVANPTGYNIGDSTRKTFEAVKNDLGRDNVRELPSIDSPIAHNEFKVALKCGPMDYHFIRLVGDKWYNKSGTTQGLYVDQSVVSADIWYAMMMEDGQPKIGDPRVGYPYYNDETIYFAVNVRWDEQ